MCHQQSQESKLLESLHKFLLPNDFWFIRNYDAAPLQGIPILEGFQPFDRSLKNDIRHHLFYELLSKGVTNMTYCRVRYRCGRYQWLLSSVQTDEGRYTSEYQGDLDIIHLRMQGTQFMTCYEEQFVSFEFYLTPFQSELWLGIGLTIIGVVTAISLYSRMNDITFSPWLLVLGTLFDEFSYVPGKMEKTTFHRLVFGVWSLIAILFTN